MGAALSHVRHHTRKALVRVILRVLCVFSSTISSLVNRLAVSPGIPVSHPSRSYWTVPPSPIAKHGSASNAFIPEYADIVIIGSGITGTSIARTILDYDANTRGAKRPLQVVMLEARDACSGATGRNGGHVTPVRYQDYTELKKRYGPQVAAQIIRFRLSHLTELLTVATEENLLDDSQCRETHSYDVYQNTDLYRYAKTLLHTYSQDLPSESSDFYIIEDAETLADLQLVPSVVGCLGSRGGAIHPYRLVTGILSRLLRCYPSSFHLFTHTPCINILPPTLPEGSYTICTSKNNIRTRHVIHATNAWASHLLPGMRNKLVPARGVMTAQHARPGLGKTKCDWRGMRSFVLYPGSSFGCFDYLTQQPPAPAKQISATYPPSSAELILGGGFMQRNTCLMELANADDSDWNKGVKDYLSKALGDYFRVGDSDENDVLIAAWSGILAISVDERPWVGRVPESLSLRSPICGKNSTDESEPWTETIDSVLDGNEGSISLAPPGEWIAAGYSGEGMVHAWLSGKAVGLMVLGQDEVDGGVREWLPEVFRVTEERCRWACVEELLGHWMMW